MRARVKIGVETCMIKLLHEWGGDGAMPSRRSNTHTSPLNYSCKTFLVSLALCGG